MGQKVFSLDTQPGIQRDGTVFDKNFYTSGQWVRFQRGRPRKIGGYRVMSSQLTGPSRGVWLNAQNGINYIYSGYNNGLQSFGVDNNGIGAGFTNYTLSNFTASNNNLWQFDGFYDVSGSGIQSLIAAPCQNLNDITNTINTPVLIGDIVGSTMSQIGVFTDSMVLNSTTTMSLAITNTLIGAGQSISGTGIPANTTVTASTLSAPNLSAVAVTGIGGQCSCTSIAGLFVGQTVRTSGTLTGTATGISTNTTYYIIATNFATTFTLSATSGGAAIVTTAGTTTGLVFTLGQFQAVTISNAATASSGATTITFNNNISVSGGVVSLHPYLFVYGNNGLIQNCAAGNTNDWVSADANATNVATGKIVQGLPVRGGSNSPSGLFWSVDSLIRVSYIGGTGTPAQYWRYDIISSQSSIMSSQCAIEYDGVYYWCGVDRFLLYNGVVKEIPNNMNQNWFFDNLNYSQRQKVWATKVPRYGEIWWFYPRGDATECTDAIVYNVRENTWYDVGQSTGAYRSAGYFSQVFAYPIEAGWETTKSVKVFSAAYVLTSGNYFAYTDTYQSSAALLQVVSGTGIVSGSTVKNITSSAIKTIGAITGGSLYTNGTYTNVDIINGTGFNAKATIVVSGNAVTSVTITARGSNFIVGNVLSAASASIGGTGSGFSFPVTAIYAQAIELSLAATASGTNTLTFSTPPDLINFYQHEIGTDDINGQEVIAIPSYFETNDLGWISGGPSQPAMDGVNRWLRVDRIEPDFIQSGDMEVYVTGRPFAQSEDVTTGPYVFGEKTGKIDMREQRREIRLRFVSNVVGGNYQLGKLLVTAEIGDTRPYGA